MLPLEAEFVQSAAEIAREVGALLTVDEVQAGLGRTGTFFAYEQLGIEPDLVTLAKGLGNGLIGALLAREGVAEAIGPGDHGSTFGGNPVASAAACAVVEAIDDARCSRTWPSAGGSSRPVCLTWAPSGRCAAAGCSSPACSTAGTRDPWWTPAASTGCSSSRPALTSRPLPPLVVTEAEVEEALAVLREVLS